MEGDVGNMAGDVVSEGGMQCQGRGEHLQGSWGKPRVTHSKKQRNFVLEAEGREMFPLGVHQRLMLWGVSFLYPSQQSECCVIWQ